MARSLSFNTTAKVNISGIGAGKKRRMISLIQHTVLLLIYATKTIPRYSVHPGYTIHLKDFRWMENTSRLFFFREPLCAVRYLMETISTQAFVGRDCDI